MPTKIKHCVIDAETNEVLDGEPSPKLVEASGEADGGKVLAYCVNGVWVHCLEADGGLAERLGNDVFTVLVKEVK